MRQMKILIANYRAEFREPYGRFRAKTEGAEENSKPIGRTTVTTNQEASELPD